jgi:zinc transport system substrate-binding protein
LLLFSLLSSLFYNCKEEIILNTKMLRTILVLFTVTAVLLGCQSQGTQESTNNKEAQISVIASFLPMYEFTKNVAGDRADVQLLVSEGQDAHHMNQAHKM